jgi:FtsP/CotA-like multicopper oxidase with cupredoxin domain
MKRPTRSSPLSLVAIVMFLLSIAVSASAVPLPGGTLDPLTIPKYATPLVIPPVMPTAGAADNYAIAVRQFRQQILPAGLPSTTVWSYGNAADNVPAVAPSATSSFNYPAFTVETIDNTPVKVRWINDLKDPVTGNFLPHLLPVDQTVHWANPPAVGCVMGMNPNSVDCRTDNAASYTGPVPLITHVHGAHVDPHSDGYPQAWFLPAANNIPAGYSMKGSFFDDSTGSNPGNLGYADFRYRNDQPAATLWYHDHALGMTRNNVYAGPAGFWIVRGGLYDGAIDNVTAGKPAAVLPGPAPVAADSLAALNTPGDPVRNAIREIPIAIQDRSFNADGSLFYPDSRAFFDGYPGPYTGSTPVSTDIAPIANVEAFFNTMVVNGNTWPVMNVAPALYRFRLLNGCNSRMLNLTLRNPVDNSELPFYQIGAEQGFLPAVVEIKTGFSTPLPGDGTIPAPVANPDPTHVERALLMGNAERADVIVDFRNLPNGTVIRMLNYGADSPFGGFPIGAAIADDNTTGQVMQFVIDDTMLVAADNTTTPPANLKLNAKAPLPAATAPARQLSLNEEESSQVCVSVDITGAITGVLQVFPNKLTGPQLTAACATLGGFPMAPKAPVLGKVDLTNPAAPVGIPLDWDDLTGISDSVDVLMADNVTVKMVSVTENPVITGGVAPIEEWQIYNFTMDAHPIHLHLVEFQVISRTDMAGVPTAAGVSPTEAGYKDTVIAYPSEITTVRAKFDIEGLYVWHCHIVEHEDNEMMRPFVVSKVATSKANSVTLTASPALTVNKGTPVVFTASANGGPGTYQYKFYARAAGSPTWAIARNWSSTPTWTWATTYAAVASYEFKVETRRVGSPAPFEADSSTVTVTVIAANAAETVTLISTPRLTGPRGTAVTWTAAASGGTGPYQYKFWARVAGSPTWLLATNWTATATWTWNTTAAALGNYEFKVDARRIGSPSPVEATSPIQTYTLIDSRAPTSVALAADNTAPAIGTPVIFTATPTGGTGPYQYKFWARAAGSTTWIVVRYWSSTATWTWSPTIADTPLGSYEFKVDCRFVGSPALFDATSPIVTVTVH